MGQQAFFYHSNCKEPGIAGLMKVRSHYSRNLTPQHDQHIHNNSENDCHYLFLQIVKEAYVDHTQFDKKDAHYDPSSKADNPKWSMVCLYTEHKNIHKDNFVLEFRTDHRLITLYRWMFSLKG